MNDHHRHIEFHLRATGDLLAVPPAGSERLQTFADRRPVCDLDHLHLFVRDLDAAARFYGDWFGLEGEVIEGTLFARNQSGFLLCLTPSPDAAPLGNTHFGFSLPSSDTVRRLHAEMLAAGAEVDAEVYEEPGFTNFGVRDPDGNTMEVFAE